MTILFNLEIEMKRKDHPQTSNDNPRYKCFKNRIDNVFDHSRNLCYVRGELDKSHDWEPVEDDGFLASDTCPGSPRRIVVMQERLKAGYPLFHSDDRKAVRDSDSQLTGGLPVRADVPDCMAECARQVEAVRKEWGLDDDQA